MNEYTWNDALAEASQKGKELQRQLTRLETWEAFLHLSAALGIPMLSLDPENMSGTVIIGAPQASVEGLNLGPPVKFVEFSVTQTGALLLTSMDAGVLPSKKRLWSSAPEEVVPWLKSLELMPARLPIPGKGNPVKILPAMLAFISPTSLGLLERYMNEEFGSRWGWADVEITTHHGGRVEAFLEMENVTLVWDRAEGCWEEDDESLDFEDDTIDDEDDD